MKKISLSLAFVAGLAGLSEAQVITYILADKICSRKQDFELVKGSGVDFYDFYLQQPSQPQRSFALRVPKLANNLYVAQVKNLQPNAAMWECADLDKMTEEFIEAVNTEKQVLQIAEKTSTGYTIYQVKTVAFYEEKPNGFSYQDQKFNFSYRYDSVYAAGANLSRGAGKVMFLEAKKENCVYKRTFKAFGDAANDLPTTLQFMEGQGLYRVAQAGTDIELKTSNGKTIAAYLAHKCSNAAGNLVDNKPKTEPKTEPKPKPEPVKATGASTSLFGGTGEHIDEKGQKTVVNSYEPSKNGNNPDNTTVVDTKPANPADPNRIPRANPELLKAEPGYHIVQEKDNLYNLSQMYGTSIEMLMFLNDLPDDKLKLNQKLKVIDDGSKPYKDPNPQIVLDEDNKVKYTIHIVHQGDNLGKIASRYNTSLLNLYQLNNLENDKLVIKQQIVVAKEELP